MEIKEFIWRGLIAAMFGYIIKLAFDPLVALFFNKLSFQSVTMENFLAIFGLCAIIGLSITIHSLILKWKNRKKEEKTNEMVSVEDYLDSLISEIELFTKKWKRGIPFVNGRGYRGEIDSKIMWANKSKIRKLATNITNSNKSLKNSLGQAKVMIHQDLFDSIDKNISRLVDLGFEVESVFETGESIVKTTQAEPNKIQQLVSLGDSIYDDFKIIARNLEKLRSHLP